MWGNAQITTKTGATYEVVEDPAAIAEIRTDAILRGPEILMELLLPTSPAQTLYVDPLQIESVRPT